MIKNVIFDMDGVLVNSEEAATHMCVSLLQKRGIPAQFNDFKEFTGMGDDKFLAGVCEKYGFAYDVSMKNELYEIYTKEAYGKVIVFPWTKHMLQTLHENKIPFAVASASDLSKVHTNIKCIGVPLDYFSAVVTGSEVARNKPFPDIFLKAAEKAGFDPKETTVVEDAVSGTMAAKSAGMKCISVTTSFSKEKLVSAGSDMVTDELYDLLTIIKSL